MKYFHVTNKICNRDKRNNRIRRMTMRFNTYNMLLQWNNNMTYSSSWLMNWVQWFFSFTFVLLLPKSYDNWSPPSQITFLQKQWQSQIMIISSSFIQEHMAINFVYQIWRIYNFYTTHVQKYIYEVWRKQIMQNRYRISYIVYL